MRTQMLRQALSSLFVLAVPFAVVAAGCSSTITSSDPFPFGDGGSGGDTGSRNDTGTTGGGATCDSSCAHITSLGLACANTNCVSQCQQVQTQCQTAGGAAQFQTLLNCTVTANYKCSTATPASPTTSDCTTQANAVVAACFNTPPVDGGGGGDAGVDSGGNPDAVCAQAASKANCENCCTTNHPAGLATFNNAFGNCACTTPGTCKTQCAASFCANPPVNPTAGDACDTCLNASLANGGACVQPVTQACQADPDCLALLGPNGCIATAGCANKP